MYVQKCFCLEETACYHAKSTEEKNVNMRYQKACFHDILPVFLLDRIRLALEPKQNKYMHLKFMLTFPGKWNMEVVTKPDPIYHYLSG